MSIMQGRESDLTNFGTWVHDFGDRLYRYQVYKRRFTPYEQDRKFTDESLFEDDYVSLGYIKEAIELPDGDVLIGFSKDAESIDYFKLSEIRLSYYESDENDFLESEGEQEESGKDYELLYDELIASERLNC